MFCYLYNLSFLVRQNWQLMCAAQELLVKLLVLFMYYYDPNNNNLRSFFFQIDVIRLIYMLIFLARKLKFFLDEYILMPEIAANMAVNTGNARPRKGGRHLIDGVDPESDFIGPHIPISTSVVQPDLYDDEDKTLKEGSNLKGDYGSIALLTFLYILQGIPLGLAGSIPMLLQSRQVSYKEQALFSFVYWPFSVKLLWAPLVDSIYWLQFGRRKTWLVPTQYLIGVFMIVLSWHIKDILGDGDEDAQVSVMLLTVIFFMLNFLAATQDIAVDGWALTMLSR